MVDVLPLVERSKGEIVGDATEGVDEVSAQVRIDVLRQKFRLSWPVSRPVGVVTNDVLVLPAGLGRLDSMAAPN